MARNHEAAPEVDKVEEKAHEDDEDILWVTAFDEDTAKNFTEKLFKAARKYPKKPILIFIDSYGGSVDALAAMIGAMDTVKNKIITVAMGKAMSAGADLLSYGDVRYAAPNARLMIHEVSAASWGNINDLKTHTSELNRLNDHWMAWLAKNCGKSLKQLMKSFTNKKRDIYMTPEQAVAFGLVDKIGIPSLKKTVKYEVED